MVIFPDHHKFTRKDTEQLRWAMERNGADGFITTQKDLMNLGELVRQFAAISIPILNVELEEADLCIDFLLQTIASRQKHRS